MSQGGEVLSGSEGVGNIEGFCRRIIVIADGLLMEGFVQEFVVDVLRFILEFLLRLTLNPTHALTSSTLLIFTQTF